jgi:hypothetical protein
LILYCPRRRNPIIQTAKSRRSRVSATRSQANLCFQPLRLFLQLLPSTSYPALAAEVNAAVHPDSSHFFNHSYLLPCSCLWKVKLILCWCAKAADRQTDNKQFLAFFTSLQMAHFSILFALVTCALICIQCVSSIELFVDALNGIDAGACHAAGSACRTLSFALRHSLNET